MTWEVKGVAVRENWPALSEFLSYLKADYVARFLYADRESVEVTVALSRQPSAAELETFNALLAPPP